MSCRLSFFAVTSQRQPQTPEALCGLIDGNWRDSNVDSAEFCSCVACAIRGSVSKYWHTGTSVYYQYVSVMGYTVDTFTRVLW
jgi:hypothetical protein